MIVEQVNAGIAAAWETGTRFGRPPVDPAVVSEKLALTAIGDQHGIGSVSADLAQGRSALGDVRIPDVIVEWSQNTATQRSSPQVRPLSQLSGGAAIGRGLTLSEEGVGDA